jgi:hypothetical protein
MGGKEPFAAGARRGPLSGTERTSTLVCPMTALNLERTWQEMELSLRANLQYDGSLRPVPVYFIS